MLVCASIASTPSFEAQNTQPIPTTGSRIPALEPHYSPDELGERWHVSPNTVRRLCEEEGEILVIDRPERMHKRRYKTIRIPQSTAVKIYERHFVRRAA